jgi:rhodanese-related sulfurtransferase
VPRRLKPEDLIALVGTDRCPHIVDVRRAAVFADAGRRIAGAHWRDHRKAAGWAREFPDRPIVVYCVHGHNVSEIAAAILRHEGRDVMVLEGGLEAYESAGGATVHVKLPGLEPDLPRPSVWVTRERPKIDRIACPWLIRRFVDPAAIFHFVAAEWVRDIAEETGAIAFDIEGVFYSHRGQLCSFDTMLEAFGLTDPALLHVARIVRGADTARPDLAPEAAGLLAISLGLSAIEPDDLGQLDKGMAIYDALYGWARHASGERHNWPAQATVA